MVKKTIYFDVMLKSSDRINLNDFKARQKVMTNDKNSVDIVFRATDVEPNDLNGATASIFLYMQDGSFFQSNSVVITNNILTYTMTQNQTQHKGTTKVQIVVKSGTIDNASLLQEFEISPGLEKYPLTEVMIQDWTTLTAEAKAFVDQIEGFTLESFVENKMGEELANLEVNYATRLTGLESKDAQLTAQLAQTAKSIGTYVIELNKFNIQPGLIGHKSPYSKTEYDRAYNNYEGIRSALNYASEQGFTEVILPKNEYVVCYQDPVGQTQYTTWNRGWEIVIPSNMTFDLGGSCISVIYDSLNRNPYDKGTLPTWNLAGIIFGFMGSNNSHIKNGELKGDRYERSYVNTNERSAEQTYGIRISSGSKFCSVKNMKIHGFMGDSITGSEGHDAKDGSSVMGGDINFSPGYINTEGHITQMDGSYSTDFHAISMGESRELVLRGYGYTRTPKFANDKAQVSWFDTNKNFISSEYIRALENVTMPYNAKYLKLSIFGEAIGLASVTKALAITPPYSHNFTVGSCEIFNNNRGGISNMVDFTVIEKCKIYQNGLGGKEGWPIFNNNTRYAINVEDTTVRHITIQDNYIYGAFYCILLFALEFTIENNHFFNVDNITPVINVYDRVHTGLITGNTLNKGHVLLGSTDYQGDRDIIVTNNIGLDSSAFSVLGDKTRLLSDNNIFKGFPIRARFEKGVASGLIIDETPNILSEYKNQLIYGTFRNSEINLDQPQYSTSYLEVTAKKGTERLTINCTHLSKNIRPGNEIYGMTLNGGAIVRQLNNETGSILFEDCTFNSIEQVHLHCYNNSSVSNWNITFKNCDFTFLGGSNILFYLPTQITTSANINLVVNLENCKITIGKEFIKDAYIFSLFHSETNHLVTINLIDVIIDTSNSEMNIELCRRVSSYENDAIINTKNLQVIGELTQSLNGYTVVPL